jgi:hypothetical protein
MTKTGKGIRVIDYFKIKPVDLVLLRKGAVLIRINHPEFSNFIRYGNRHIKNTQGSK